MATVSEKKPRCATCNKAAGIFSCYGCSQNFCLDYVGEHRQLLKKELDENVIQVHDELVQCLTEHLTNLDEHPCMREINEWEQQQVDAIRRIAADTRLQLRNSLTKQLNDAKISLESFTQKLVELQNDNEFVENDIDEWKKQLENLRKEMNAKSMISIHPNESIDAFIPRIYVSNEDVFNVVDGHIQIEDDGRTIVHDQSVGDSAARGKLEYSSGNFFFRFKIEYLDCDKWAFLGIVSKTAAIQQSSYFTPTTYGWAGRDQVYLNGTQQSGYRGYTSDIDINDILELLIDCDQRIIQLKNLRTKSVHELYVDTTKCPFPWQLNFCLAYPRDRSSFLR